MVYHYADDGFRLTYLGYDFLAIKTMVNRGIFTGVGRQIGVGKESGIIPSQTLINQVLLFSLVCCMAKCFLIIVSGLKTYLRL